VQILRGNFSFKMTINLIKSLKVVSYEMDRQMITKLCPRYFLTSYSCKQPFSKTI